MLRPYFEESREERESSRVLQTSRRFTDSQENLELRSWEHLAGFTSSLIVLVLVTLVSTCFCTGCFANICKNTHLDVPVRTVSRGSPGALPGSPGVRSQPVRESSRKLEKVRERLRKLEEVGEGWRKFDKV